MKKISLFIALLFTIALAATLEERTEVARRDGAPVGWERMEATHPSTILSFTVLLKLRNVHKLNREFERVSSPQNHRYGKFWTLQAVENLIKPSEDSFAAVLKWSEEFVGAKSTVGPDYVKIEAPAHVAAEMLGAQFYAFKNIKSGKVLDRAFGSISLPNRLGPHVDFVAGITELFVNDRLDGKLEYVEEVSPKKDGKIPPNTPVPSSIFVNPSVLRKYYGIPETSETTHPNNLPAIAAFNDFYSRGAFASFQKHFNFAPTNVTYFGPDCLSEGCDSLESNLDVQYITAVSKTRQLYLVDSGTYWLLHFVTEVLAGLPKMPLVFSISYAWPELDQCRWANCTALGYNSTQYVDRTNIGFQKMGMIGISVITADGDWGAGAGACDGFKAYYPSVSPYVTSVGATYFYNDTTNPNELREAAVSAPQLFWSTSGGFSTFQPSPAYQRKAVQNWYALASKLDNLPPSDLFNIKYRGYPDISFNGHNYHIFNSNSGEDSCPCSEGSVDGTSASTPAFAGMITLINDIILHAGKTPLGFLNPLLYQMAEVNPRSYREVTQGNNFYGCPDGFVAQKGWNPVSGLGTPNYPYFLGYIKKVKRIP